METKTLPPPVINLNLWVQNYVNVYNPKEESSFSAQFPSSKASRDAFTKEYAKPSPNSFNSKPFTRTISSPTSSLASVSADHETLPSIEMKEMEKTSQIYEERARPGENSHLYELLGFFLIGFAVLLFTIMTYAVVLSPLLEKTGHSLLDFVREDYYYALLLPLMFPVTYVVGYFNWVSIKFFRHS